MGLKSGDDKMLYSDMEYRVLCPSESFEDFFGSAHRLFLGKGGETHFWDGFVGVFSLT